MAKLSHLLLYDPDPSGLETLSYVFQREGCKVRGTGDATKVSELVQAEGAPLVLLALRDPEQTAIDLIRDITGNPRTRNTACIAIGPARLRSAALQAGAFGLLASPVFLRDVLDASKLVAAATVQGSRPSADTDIALKLSELGGVYYLIRALAASARSAAVEISRGARRGELRFIDGELSSVQVGPLSGMPALHQALLWDEADLKLKFRNVARRAGQLSLKSDELLQECDRFLRDFAHDVKDLGVAGTIYRPSSDARPTSSLPSEVVPLLRLFDGTRTLAGVLEESPFRVFDTLRIVHQFAAAEAIRADGAAARIPVPMPPGPVALAAWFQHPSVVPDEDRPTPPPEPVARRELAHSGPPRSAAPFVPVAPSRAADNSGVPRAARRTPTRRDYLVEARREASDKDAMEATPPALVTAPAVPIAERPRVPSGGVARGEIQIAAPLPLRKKVENPIKPDVPSVMVELGAVPQARPVAALIEAPLPVRQAPSGGTVAPVAAPTAIPAKGPALRKKTPVPEGAEPSLQGRAPSNGFNAVEADFFEREADLYKRESVETFDDLEGGATGTRRGTVPKT